MAGFVFPLRGEKCGEPELGCRCPPLCRDKRQRTPDLHGGVDPGAERSSGAGVLSRLHRSHYSGDGAYPRVRTPPRTQLVPTFYPTGMPSTLPSNWYPGQQRTDFRQDFHSCSCVSHTTTPSKVNSTGLLQNKQCFRVLSPSSPPDGPKTKPGT